MKIHRTDGSGHEKETTLHKKQYKYSQENYLTAAMVENFLFESLFSGDIWTEVIFAISEALRGNGELLFEMASGWTINSNDIPAMLATTCADGQDSTKYSLKEWKSKLETSLPSDSTFAKKLWAPQFLGWYGIN
jgi:hypothetical protein